jgi:hypothetical protein
MLLIHSFECLLVKKKPATMPDASFLPIDVQGGRGKQNWYMKETTSPMLFTPRWLDT